MGETTSSLIIGISGSLIATFIFIGGSEIFRKIIIPWFSDVIYTGVRIDGEWKLEDDEDDPSSSISLSLKQNADRVTGLLIYEIYGEKSSFTFSGNIQNMLLLGTALPISKKVIDGASLLLHIDQVKGSLKMTGGYCLYEKAGEISVVDNVSFIEK